MSTLSEKEREEISLLLPWYANGTLGDEDSRKVEAALARDDALAREFDLVLEDQAAVIELVSEEEVPISIEERFKAALNSQSHEMPPDAAPGAARERLFSRVVSAFFSKRPRGYAYVAAAIVLLLPALAIVSFMSPGQQSGQYQTATGEADSGRATARVLVKFNIEAAWSEIDAFLKENRVQVVSGPSADGLYELKFEKAKELAAKMTTETGLFEFVLPAD